MTKELDALLTEKRIFEPDQNLVNNTNIKKFMDDHNIGSYDELLERAKDREWFWGELSKEIDWFQPYHNVLDSSDAPYFKWFTEGKCNIVHNALDRHIETPRKNKIAIIWEGEPGEVRKFTYQDLYVEVNKFANVLKDLGIKRGDRVSIYLPMIPELPIAMMACAKIGAIHSVVFSGFSTKAFADRARDAKAKVAITVDGFYRNGKIINLKKNADAALKDVQSVKHLVVIKRAGNEVEMEDDRDEWWHDLMEGRPAKCETEVMDAEDTLFILYTSGTTGKPKGVVHVHGGYSVGIANTLKYVFDAKDDDVWWCAADIGWITGHSYIVYAPLILGLTSVMYEGSPLYPKPDRIWKIIDDYKVSILYTAPTAIRMFMKYGVQWPEAHDLTSLRMLGSVGEPINPEAWIWYHVHIGKERCPIMDTWWQTETGAFMLTPLPITNLKPGSATKPFPSIEADVLNDEGESITGQGGQLVIKTPWPSMLRTLYKDPARYEKTYWSRFEGVYLTGDVARIDEDGYFWVQGRGDDVLNVAGHRIGTAEVESALVSHKAVAEAAVVGVPDELRGEVINAFVILRQGFDPKPELKQELVAHVGEEIGHIAKPAALFFVNDLPKTRSGKIMRRVIKAKATGQEVGDISTLANPEAVEGLDKAI